MASPHAMALLQERQCQKIYSALDSGNSLAAIREAEKVLAGKKPSSFPLAAALKAIALTRTRQMAAASTICDDLLALSVLPPNTMRPLCMALQGLGRVQDEVKVLEAASKANSANVDLGRKTFLAMAKAGMWMKAQQVALRLHKAASSSSSSSKGKKDEYFWWSVAAYVLLSRQPDAQGAQLALPLADRMVQKQLEAKPFGERSEEELFLHVDIKGKLAEVAKGGEDEKRKLYAEAVKLLEEGVGKVLVERNLGLEVRRLELRRLAGAWEGIRDDSKQRLLKGNRNWLHFSALVEACVALDMAPGAKADACKEADKTLRRMAEGEDAGDRGIRLARLYLHSQTIDKGIAWEDKDAQGERKRLLELCVAYFNDFNTKACATEDLLPHLRALGTEEREGFSKEVESLDPTHNAEVRMRDDKELCTALNAARLRRALQPLNAVQVEHERRTARVMAEAYFKALPVGAKLPLTEMQPADDFALLSAHASIAAWASSSSDEGTHDLLSAVSLLRFALQKSPKGYRLRFLLVRLLLLLGDFSAARVEYGKAGVKAVINDTLGWIILEGFSAATFALGGEEEGQGEAKGKGKGEGKGEKEGKKRSEVEAGFQILWGMNRIYVENDSDTRGMLGRAFEHGTYSKVEEFVDFYRRLDNSATRLLLASEFARVSAVLDASPFTRGRKGFEGSKLWTSELDGTEKEHLLKPLARGEEVSDQRDAKVFPTTLPLGSSSVEHLTAWSGSDGLKKEGFAAVRFVGALAVGDEAAAPEVIDEAMLSKQLSPPSLAQYKLLASCVSPSGASSVGASLERFIKTQTDVVRSVKGPRAFVDVVQSATTVLEALRILQHHPATARGVSEHAERLKGVIGEMGQALRGREWALGATPAELKVPLVEGVTPGEMEEMGVDVEQKRSRACQKLAELIAA